MKTRTLFGIIFLTAAFSVHSFAQKFHPGIQLHFTQNLNAMLDSIETPHLRVNIQQPDKNEMKFRIDVANPRGRRTSITIRKKDDIYIYENVTTPVYVSMYDFNQAEDGDYQVIVVGGKEKVCANISIHTETQVSRQVTLH